MRERSKKGRCVKKQEYIRESKRNGQRTRQASREKWVLAISMGNRAEEQSKATCLGLSLLSAPIPARSCRSLANEDCETATWKPMTLRLKKTVQLERTAGNPVVEALLTPVAGHRKIDLEEVETPPGRLSYRVSEGAMQGNKSHP